MLIIENASMLDRLEAIDIENDEYIFWDSNGGGVCITVAKNKVTEVISCTPVYPMQEAFLSYMSSLGMSEKVAEGTPLGFGSKSGQRWPGVPASETYPRDCSTADIPKPNGFLWN